MRVMRERRSVTGRERLEDWALELERMSEQAADRIRKREEEHESECVRS